MSKKAYTPRFTQEGTINPEFTAEQANKKRNPANFKSAWDNIDHVATASHQSRFNKGLQLALEAETGRTGLTLSQLKSI